jgi:hypothetical protein
MAATTDLRSDNFRRLSYISITVHFIRNKTLCERILAVKQFNYDKQTGVNIIDKIRKFFKEYDISETEKTIFVTDRGANVKLVKYFKKGNNLQKSLKTTLKSHCPTRWNTNYFMPKSILDNWAKIILF